MKNYISINNGRIELPDDLIQKILDAYNIRQKQLSKYAAGDVVNIGCFEMVVLEQFGNETALILKNFYSGETPFGESNNYYNGSFVDDRCQDFAAEIANIVGADNIILHTVDLTSDDGLKDYGTIERRASLITAEMYRKYVEILDKFNPEKWWWLATAHSTKKHGNDSWAKCVSPSGYVRNGGYYYGGGVRPFCILKSTIFVSMGEEK